MRGRRKSGSRPNGDSDVEQKRKEFSTDRFFDLNERVGVSTGGENKLTKLAETK